MERFWYILKDISNIKFITKWFVCLVCNRQKLVKTGIFRFKTWFCEIKPILIQSRNISWNTVSNVLRLCKIESNETGVVFQTLPSFFFFLWMGAIFLFFNTDGKIQFDKHSWKMNDLFGLRIDFSQISNFRMLMISWLYALFGSNFWIISNTR